MEKKELFGICPFVTSQKLLAGKWNMYILHLLSHGPVRFNELQRKKYRRRLRIRRFPDS